MTNQFLNFDEIQKKFGIKDFELFAEIKTGLPAYSKGNREKPLKPTQIEIDENEYQARKIEFEAYQKRISSRNSCYVIFPTPYHIKDCLFLESDLEAIGLKLEKLNKAQLKTACDILPIHTAQIVTWKHIIMTVRNYEFAELKFPGGFENRRLSDMGLKERGKTGKPTTILTFFLQMALNGGELKPTTGTDDVKQTVKRLRKTLRALFPDISGDPLPYIKGQWQTVFRLTADIENLLETMPDASREQFISHLQNQ